MVQLRVFLLVPGHVLLESIRFLHLFLVQIALRVLGIQVLELVFADNARQEQLVYPAQQLPAVVLTVLQEPILQQAAPQCATSAKLVNTKTLSVLRVAAAAVLEHIHL